jgi:hypothetical protein
MGLIPRSNEVAAVAAILESPEYDDAPSMSKAIVKAVADELLKRDTVVIVPQGQPFGYGPYWSETQAEKAWTKEIGPSVGDTPAGLLKAYPWAPPEEIAAHVDCTCGHARELHVVKNQRGGKTVSFTECGLTGCECKNYGRDAS